jgi:cyclic beta-1,2-glucan synthetase
LLAFLSGAFKKASAPLPEPPIRAELFGLERLEQHAESLAAAQHIASSPRASRHIAPRLYDNTVV